MIHATLASGQVGAENMAFQYVPWVIPNVVAVVLSCGLTALAWQRRALPLAPDFCHHDGR